MQIAQRLVVPTLSPVGLAAMEVGHHRLGPKRQGTGKGLGRGVAVPRRESLFAGLEQPEVFPFAVGPLDEQHARGDDHDQSEESGGPFHCVDFRPVFRPGTLPVRRGLT